MELWFIGNSCEDHVTIADSGHKYPRRLTSLVAKKLMLYYAIFSGNLLMPRLYIILRPIKLATLWNQEKKLYTNDI